MFFQVFPPPLSTQIADRTKQRETRHTNLEGIDFLDSLSEIRFLYMWLIDIKLFLLNGNCKIFI